MRGRITYANVAATLALIVALSTGGAYAALGIPNGSITSLMLANNGVKPADIKDGKLTAKEIKPESLIGDVLAPKTITAKAVADNSLTGEQIVGGSLQGVNAASVDGKSLACPGGTRFYVWGCWETSANSGVNWTGAVLGCAGKDGVLPSAAELAAFAEEPGISIPSGAAEWTSETTLNPSDALVSLKFYDPTTVDFAAFTETHPYRCVLPIVR
jgi:hypothetical protein